MHSMVPLGEEAHVEAHFGLLDIVLILMQDRCTVCVEHTIGSDIILDAPDGILGDMGHVESHFIPFGDSFVSVQDRCMVCARCIIGLQIILDAPDGTPR